MLVSKNPEVISSSAVLQASFPPAPRFYDSYRVVRLAVASRRGSMLWDAAYATIMSSRKGTPTGRRVLQSGGVELLGRTLYRPSSSQAAFGLHRLQHLDESNRCLEERAQRLAERCQDLPGVELQRTTVDSTRVYTRFLVKTPGCSRQTVTELNRRGVEAKHLAQEYSSTYQEPVEELPEFARKDSARTCRTYRSLHDRVVTLPLSPSTRCTEIARIARELGSVLRRPTRDSESTSIETAGWHGGQT